MTSPKDEVLAKIAVERGFLTAQQVEECRKSQLDMPSDPEMTIGRARVKPLGSVMVEKGMLTPDQLSDLVAEQGRRQKSFEKYQQMVQAEMSFAQLLVKHNKVTQNQINKCLEIQRISAEKGKDPVPTLIQLIAEHGFVDGKALTEVQKLHEKNLLICTNCGQQFNVVGVESGKAYKCRSCGGLMMTPEMIRTLKPGDAAFPGNRQ